MNNVAGVGLKNISQRGHIYSNVVVVLDRNFKNNAVKKCPKKVCSHHGAHRRYYLEAIRDFILKALSLIIRKGGGGRVTASHYLSFPAFPFLAPLPPDSCPSLYYSRLQINKKESETWVFGKPCQNLSFLTIR